MADYYGLTSRERMNTINGDGISEFTLNEAFNKWLKDAGTYNSVDYSDISYTEYTDREALNIIYKNDGVNSMPPRNILSLMAGGSANQYTPTEALNILEDADGFNAGIPA